MEAPRIPTIIPMWITGASKSYHPCRCSRPHIPRSYEWKYLRTHPPPRFPAPRLRPWHTGFDNLMPEGRRVPWKFLPRPGARLSVTFGAPLSPEAVRATMVSRMGLDLEPWRDGEGKVQQGRLVKAKVDLEAEVAARIALTELMQRAVEALGRQVSGDLLTGSPQRHRH